MWGLGDFFDFFFFVVGEVFWVFVGCSYYFFGEGLGVGVFVFVVFYVGVKGDVFEGYVEFFEWGDVNGYVVVDFIEGDGCSVFFWGGVFDGFDENLDWVLFGFFFDDYEGFFDDFVGFYFFVYYWVVFMFYEVIVGFVVVGIVFYDFVD